ncbi:MAG: diacylglycerol kinase family protein [Clostridia bacterium]|nr:diacylglycerol kinase family protein [Clostridia bacterium]
MEKYTVLYNKLSGVASEAVKTLETLIKEKGEVDIRDITAIGGYEEFFKELPDDSKLVICGGDGTLNRFVNEAGAFIGEREIYYFPAGTGNDFARDVELDFTKGPAEISKYLKSLPTVTVKGKSGKFINGVGYGIDGYCCQVGDEMKAKSDKPVNYTSIAIKGLPFHFKSKVAQITVDGKAYSFKNVWIAPTMIGRFYGGGMNAAPAQDRLSGDKTVSLVVMHGRSRIGTLIIFPSIFKGEHIKHEKKVSVITGHNITVKFNEPSPLQIDGETVLDVSEYSVSFE